MGDPEELELVRACVRGDEAAWVRFYERYQRLVLRVASESLRGWGQRDAGTLAQDAAADVFAHLLDDERRVLASFGGRSSLATWLRVVTRRRTGRLLRARSRREADELPAEGLAAEQPSPSDVATVSERDALVREQVARLSARDRLALQLFYEGGRSYREVADALDLPPENVGTLLARARARLKGLLGGSGVEE